MTSRADLKATIRAALDQGVAPEDLARFARDSHPGVDRLAVADAMDEVAADLNEEAAQQDRVTMAAWERAGGNLDAKLIDVADGAPLVPRRQEDRS